jgi:ATP-binding protein involved in chromosome partitioning
VSGYTQQTLKQTDWGKLDYLIIDLPPGTGDIQLTIVQQAALDGAIIVTTPQALSLVDVAKGILMFEKVNVPVLGVIENMCSYTCDQCDTVHYPFGRSRGTLQQRFGLPTLAELPISPHVAEIESAAGLKALDTLAENVHRAVGTSRAAKPEVPDVQVEQGAIRIRWPDGYEAAFSNHDLRCACPCAMCVDETTGERTLEPASVPQDIAVEGAQLLGNYAVAFTWSDGHATGIYAWDYLRAIAEGVAVK